MTYGHNSDIYISTFPNDIHLEVSSLRSGFIKIGANTSVAQLGEGILTIGATAKSVKGGTAELNTALGILANNGIKGAEGGTHLRNIILSLQNPTDKAAASMEQLGVDVYDSQGNMRSMNDILGDLNTSMDGMTAAEKSNIISNIFNKTDLSSVNALLANTGDTWDDLQTSITNSGGAAQQMADTQLDNLQGQLTILKSALEGLAISFGELLMPAIKQIVGWVQKFVDWLNGMDEGTKKVVVTVALFAAALGPVLIIVGKVISAVGTIMTIVPKIAGVINTVKGAFAALNATMLANPIILIIAAIAALVAAFIYLWNTNEDFRQFWIDLWENIKEVAIAVWNAIKDFFVAVWEGIKSVAETVWNALASFFTGLWEGIKTVFTTAVTAISTFLSTAWNTIKTVVTTVFTAIQTFFTTVWNTISTIVTTVVTAIQTFLTTAWNAIKTAISTVLTAIQTVVTTVWNAISIFITTIVTAIQTFLTTAWNTIKTVITTVLNAIKTVFTTIWNAIKSVITTVVNGIKNTITTVWNNIKSTVSSVVNGIKTAVSSAFSAIWNGIKNTISGIYNTIQGGFDKAVGYIKNLASSAFNWGKDLVMGIVNGIKSCISAVGDAVSGVANKIKSFLHFSVPDEGPLTDYETWMPDFMSGLAKGIEKSKGMVASAMDGVAADMVVNPKISTADTSGILGGMSAGDTIAGITTAITEALSGIGGQNGDIVIPVYLGGTMLDEVVVNAQQRTNLRSGGR